MRCHSLCGFHITAVSLQLWQNTVSDSSDNLQVPVDHAGAQTGKTYIFVSERVMNIFLSTCNFHCSSLFACWSQTILPTWHSVSPGPFFFPYLATQDDYGNLKRTWNRTLTWWHRKIKIKVNDEPSCDILFRNLALLPWGSPEDQQEVTTGDAVMDTWKRVMLKMLFFSFAFVYLPRGQERKKNPSPAWLIVMTLLQIIVPCW